MIEIELPYPPSINHYYRWTGRGMFISARGIAYRCEVYLECMKHITEPMNGELSIRIVIYPPDKRKRDIDNVLKALLDALEKGGAYHNDSQIKKLTIEMMEPVEDGMCLVRIEPKRNSKQRHGKEVPMKN